MSVDFENLVASLGADEQMIGVIRELGKGPISDEEVDLYKDILRSRDALVDRNLSGYYRIATHHLMKTCPENLAVDINSHYQYAINRTMILKGDVYKRVAADFLSYFSGERIPLSRFDNLLGGFVKNSEVILLDDENFGSRSATEEYMHSFLQYLSRPQDNADTLRMGFDRHMANVNRQNLIEPLLNKEPYISKIESYYSDPEEQIAKALTLPCLGERTQAPLGYLESARMGMMRIHELGWERIRQGDYITDHEADFVVVFPSERDQKEILSWQKSKQS
ncbi:hypothetical protein C4564_04435 [Candidatus Microgenomates bacterium]|nr:MAG: hypothetical protein C4564_04435 [Candidatus Microgenomates bacterium]